MRPLLLSLLVSAACASGARAQGGAPTQLEPVALEAETDARRAATPHVLRLMGADAAASADTADAPRPNILVASDMDERGLAALRKLGEVEYASFRDKGRLLTGEALAEVTLQEMSRPMSPTIDFATMRVVDSHS